MLFFKTSFYLFLHVSVTTALSFICPTSITSEKICKWTLSNDNFKVKYTGHYYQCGSKVKASVRNAGDLGLIPGLGRSPGEGNDNLLQCSCLENPMDGGAWWSTVHGVAKSQTQLSDFSFTTTTTNIMTVIATTKTAKILTCLLALWVPIQIHPVFNHLINFLKIITNISLFLTIIPTTNI